MSGDPAEFSKDRPKGVPPAPSKAYVEQVSKDQALIADEWAPAPAHPASADETVKPPGSGPAE